MKRICLCNETITDKREGTGFVPAEKARVEPEKPRLNTERRGNRYDRGRTSTRQRDYTEVDEAEREKEVVSGCFLILFFFAFWGRRSGGSMRSKTNNNRGSSPLGMIFCHLSCQESILIMISLHLALFESYELYTAK